MDANLRAGMLAHQLVEEAIAAPAVNDPEEPDLGMYEDEWDEYDHMAEKDNDARRFENKCGGDW